MPSLPSFAAVRAFDAAARHLSFKEAALELGLTPTAISHQIKQLEQSAGRSLFVRHTRRVELTAEGQSFASAIRPALEAMATAYAGLCASSSRQYVTLGVGPIFASRWLVPRLAEFWAAHSGIDLRVHHSPLPVWQQLAQFDLAVAWGNGRWLGVVTEPLLRIDVTPVLAPELVHEMSVPATPHDLLSFPLLHHRDTSGWRQWFMAAGVSAQLDLPGTVFEDSNVLLHAALSGRGVALGILQFIADELSGGRLVRPFAASVDPGDAYYLIYPPSGLTSAASTAVREWMLAQP